jgi:hypothetical protein
VNRERSFGVPQDDNRRGEVFEKPYRTAARWYYDLAIDEKPGHVRRRRRRHRHSDAPDVFDVPETSPLTTATVRGRTILLGLVGLIVSCVFGHALRFTLLGETAIAVLLGLAGVALFFVGLSVARNAWLAVFGLSVMVLPMFVVWAAIDVPLVGRTVETTVANAPAARSLLTTGFRLTNGAVVRSDLAQAVGMSREGRHGGRVFFYTYTAAPVVGAGWQAGDPVTVWVVNQDKGVPPEWSQPHGALLRWLDDDLFAEAVDGARTRLHLPPVDRPVIGQWVADPFVAQRAVLAMVVLMVGLPAVVWTILSFVATSNGRE